MRTCVLALRPLALASAVVVCWTVPCQAFETRSAYRAAVESIRAEDIQNHVEYLADEALEGREAGAPGGKLAADYLRDRLRELGIRGAGIDGGFDQPFLAGYRNILGLIEGSDPQLKNQVVLVCAHYDHVGYGTEENSRGPIGQIHNGADDNASGTSAVLELAEAFTKLPNPPRRSILFAFWDAEELGMVGSKHWATEPTVPLDRIVATVNLDMVGRLRNDQLTVYGSRSGFGLRRLVSRHNDRTGLSVDFSWELEDDADHYTFFKKGIPVLFFHTGVHDQWHGPGDDVELINEQGIRRVTRLTFEVTHDLAQRDEVTGFREVPEYETEAYREQLAQRVPNLPDRLGVQVSRQSSADSGVRALRIDSGSAAAKAGIRPGDRIVRLAGHEVANGEELTSAVLQAEHQVPIVVRRPRQREPISLTVELDGHPLRLGITWRSDDAEPGTVVLSHVLPGSSAAGAGLRAGDRVYQIDGHDFADSREFAQQARQATGQLRLLVERDGRIRPVVIHLESQVAIVGE